MKTRTFILLSSVLVAVATLADSAQVQAKARIIVDARREAAAQALADRIARERGLLDTNHLLWRAGLGQLLATRSARLWVPVKELEALTGRPADAPITTQDLCRLYRVQVDIECDRSARKGLGHWVPESDLYGNTTKKFDRALAHPFRNAAVFARAYRLQEDLRMLLYYYGQTGIPLEKAQIHLFGSLGKGRFTSDSDPDLYFEQTPNARHLWPPDGKQTTVSRDHQIPWINKMLPDIQYDGVVARSLRQKIRRLFSSANMARLGTLDTGARGAKGTRTAGIGDPRQVVSTGAIQTNPDLLASIVERSFAAVGVPLAVLAQARAEGARLAGADVNRSDRWRTIIEGTAQIKAGSKPAMLPR